MHNILLAHGLSVEALKSNNSHEIGIVLNNQYAEPLDQKEENLNAAKLFDSIHNRWFSDAIFKGIYPELALSVLEDYLPKNYDNDLRAISHPLQWIGLNYYTRSIIKYDETEDGINLSLIHI